MHTIVLNTKPQYLKAPEETGRGGVAEEAAKNKATPDFAKLIADSHLTREEVRIMKELYESKKENITLAIKGQLKDFIIKDYGEANRQYLGGFEGIVALQKILGVEPDGSFGPDTFKALIEYQGSNGLEKDGIAGPDTMKKIGITSKMQGTMSGVQDKNSTPTPLSKNTEKGGIKEASAPLASTSVEKPRKDVGKILSSFEFKLNGIQNSFSDLKKNRDENTGFFNVLADDLVNFAGWESGKKIYERSNQHIKNQASEMIKNLDASLNGVPRSPAEDLRYRQIRSELEKTLGHTLGGPNVLTTIKNSVIDAPNTAVNAVVNAAKGTAGVAVGAAEGVYGAIKGIFDLTIFATRYMGSSIGEYMGVNPDYKNKMDAEIKKIYTTIKDTDFTKEQVFNAISQGFDQIKGDPYAIGKLAGIVIGILMPIKGAGALNGAVRSKKAVAQTAENAVEVAIKLGKPTEIASAKYASKLAKVDAFIWKAGEFVLNGPAESAIGAGLSKSFRLASGAIRGGVSAKNLKTVEESIQDFGDAMKNETNPERLKYLREAQEALESERDKLAKNIAAKKEKGEKSDNPESEAKVKESRISSSAPKAFDVSGIDTPEGFKKTYRKVSMYYHPDRNSHPDSEALFKELKVAFGENKADRFARVAKNPEEYLKNKDGIAEGVGKPLKTPTEVILDRLSDYEKVFSESYLRQLAQSDPQEFGMAMVHQYQIRQIKELAKTDPVEALKKGEAYLKSPDKYLKSAYPSAYYPIDKDIRGFANEAYAGAYKTELGLLQKRYNDTLENYLKNNPDSPKSSFERVQKITNNLDEVMGLLGSKASDIAKNIEEIMSLLKGNIKNNLSEIRTRIDTVIESVRLNQNISLDIKKRISSKIKDIKVLFSNKNSSDIETHNSLHSKKPETQEAPEVKAPKQEKGVQPFDPDKVDYNEISGDANRFFYEPSMPKPRYKIIVDGKEFIFSNVFDGGGNKTILGYVKIDGKYEPRYFYYSNSGGNWHCAPGVDRANGVSIRISKGEQWNESGYTKGTVVSDDLQAAFSQTLPVKSPGNFAQIWGENMGELEFGATTRSDIRYSDFKNRQYVNISDKLGGVNPEITSHDLGNMRIDPKLDLSFRGGITRGPEVAPHKYFGALDTYIGTTYYNGQPVEVIFRAAKNNPDLVWIENIRLKDCPTDSHGIPQVVFNGGILTAKPAEYMSVVPEYIANTGIRLKEGRNPYIDMRPFLQDNPLILQFKRLTGMREAA